MEQLNFLLDIVLIVISVWMIYVIRGFGGLVGRSFALIAWGCIFLGLAHLTETLLFEVLQMDVAMIESIHRVQVVLGFIFLILGFKKISGAG